MQEPTGHSVNRERPAIALAINLFHSVTLKGDNKTSGGLDPTLSGNEFMPQLPSHVEVELIAKCKKANFSHFEKILKISGKARKKEIKWTLI